MKYKYRAVWPPPSPSGKFIKRSLIEIEIFGPKGKRKELALIDSGADRSLFNYETAEILGIDLSGAESASVTGITGSETVLFKEIEIKVEFLEKKFKLTAGFIKSPYVSALLGQDGFSICIKLNLRRITTLLSCYLPINNQA